MCEVQYGKHYVLVTKDHSVIQDSFDFLENEIKESVRHQTYY